MTEPNKETTETNVHPDAQKVTESLEKVTKELKQTNGGLAKLANKIETRDSHTMKLVAAGTLAGGTAGFLVVHYTVPKATTTDKIGGAALGAAMGVTMSLAVNEVLENSKREGGKKKEDDKSAS